MLAYHRLAAEEVRTSSDGNPVVACAPLRSKQIFSCVMVNTRYTIPKHTTYDTRYAKQKQTVHDKTQYMTMVMDASGAHFATQHTRNRGGDEQAAKRHRKGARASNLIPTRYEPRPAHKDAPLRSPCLEARTPHSAVGQRRSIARDDRWVRRNG